MSSFGTKSSQTLTVDVGPPDVRPTILPAPVHPEAIALHRYWLACQARGGLKLGRDLPSREIAKLMSKLSVLEANADESDFRFRLVGSSWLDRFGRDIKGEWVSSLYEPDIFEQYRAGVCSVLKTGSPKFTDVRIYERRQLSHHLEYTQLPLVAQAETDRCILMGAFRHE